MKTVAYVMRSATGGMRRHLIDLIRNLDRNRYDPIVLSPADSDLRAPLDRLETELIEIDLPEQAGLARHAEAITRLITSLTALAPDVIHAHSNQAALFVEIAARRGSITTPVVFSMHNFPSYRDAGRARRAVSSFTMRRVVRGCARVITVSGSLRDYLVEVERVEPAKITVIHNAVDTDRFKPSRAAEIARLRQELGLSSSTPVIGTVARLVPFKGIDVLINAAPELVHKFPGMKIVIAGVGPLERTLRAQAAALGLARDIIFVGRVEDQRPYFSIFDVFVLPSRQEPFGLTILEAMASGCPVVATRGGGVPEIIDNRETGLLVPVDDPIALARSVRGLLLDRKEARAMAARARAMLSRRFTLGGMAAATEGVYDSVIADSSDV